MATMTVPTAAVRPGQGVVLRDSPRISETSSQRPPSEKVRGSNPLSSTNQRPRLTCTNVADQTGFVIVIRLRSPSAHPPRTPGPARRTSRRSNPALSALVPRCPHAAENSLSGVKARRWRARPRPASPSPLRRDPRDSGAGAPRAPPRPGAVAACPGAEQQPGTPTSAANQAGECPSDGAGYEEGVRPASRQGRLPATHAEHPSRNRRTDASASGAAPKRAHQRGAGAVIQSMPLPLPPRGVNARTYR